MLGFRIDPAERLVEVHKEVMSLFRTFRASPIFGVEHTVEEKVRGSWWHRTHCSSTFSFHTHVLLLRCLLLHLSGVGWHSLHRCNSYVL